MKKKVEDENHLIDIKTHNMLCVILFQWVILSLFFEMMNIEQLLLLRCLQINTIYTKFFCCKIFMLFHSYFIIIFRVWEKVEILENVNHIHSTISILYLKYIFGLIAVVKISLLRSRSSCVGCTSLGFQLFTFLFKS